MQKIMLLAAIFFVMWAAAATSEVRGRYAVH